jgi:hypothetical protein
LLTLPLKQAPKALIERVSSKLRRIRAPQWQ